MFCVAPQFRRRRRSKRRILTSKRVRGKFRLAAATLGWVTYERLSGAKTISCQSTCFSQPSCFLALAGDTVRFVSGPDFNAASRGSSVDRRTSARVNFGAVFRDDSDPSLHEAKSANSGRAQRHLRDARQHHSDAGSDGHSGCPGGDCARGPCSQRHNAGREAGQHRRRQRCRQS